MPINYLARISKRAKLTLIILAAMAATTVIARTAIAALVPNQAPVFETSVGSPKADGFFALPSGVAVSPDETKIYVADSNNHRIQVFNASNHSFISKFGTFGTGDGEFNKPSKLAISPDGTRLYVADTQNGRIQVFNTSNNAFVSKFGSAGTGDGQFAVNGSAMAGGMVVSPDGETLYVSDTTNRRVQLFDITDNHAYTGQFGSSGTGDGEFSGGVSDVAISPDGATLYVTDGGNGRVQLFDTTDNSYIDQFATTSPSGLALTADGSLLYVFDNSSNKSVRVYDTTDNSLEDQFGSQGTGDGQFAASTCCNGGQFQAIDLVGDKLYVADDGNNRVQIFDTDTNSFLTKFGTAGAGDGVLDSPGGLVVSSDMTKVYVADRSNNRIQIFNATTNAYLGQFGSAGSGNGQFATPTDVSLSKDGTRLYVLDSDNHRIQIFNTSNNAYVGQFGSQGSGNGQFDYPSYLAMSPDGTRLYVSDSDNHRIQIFNTSNNAYVGQFGSQGSGNGQFGGWPGGLNVSPDGARLYVADGDNRRVQIFNTTNNAYVGQFGEYGPGNGQFYGPTDVVVSPDGSKLYVSDSTENRVQIFNSSNNAYVNQFGTEGDGDAEFSNPTGINISSDGSKLYISDTDNDRYQVTSYSNYVMLFDAPKPVEISTPNGTSLTCSYTTANNNLPKQDGSFSYPLGLVNFCFTTEDGQNEVSLTFITDLKPNEVTPRKYSLMNDTYSTVNDVEITETQVNGQHALQVTYTVEDNGPLDDNPAVGIIEDPVGLAVAPGGDSSNDGLAGTGSNTWAVLALALGSLAAGSVAVLRTRRSL